MISSIKYKSIDKNMFLDTFKQLEEVNSIISSGNYNLEEINTSISTYENCKKFIYTVCNEIYSHSGKILSAPYIDIMHDDSIAVRWENDKSKFLIIFKNDNFPVAYFYAESSLSNSLRIPFNSGIEINGHISESVIRWMEENLT